MRTRATPISPLALVAASLAAAFAYWSPAFAYLEQTGFGDWQQFQHQWEVMRVALLRYGEIPLWNPWHCGGTLYYGDPQAQGYGPVYLLLALPFGTVLGAKLFMVAHAAAGFAGMYVLSRRLFGVSEVSACTAAVVFAGSGFFAWHGSGGHSAFMPFYLLPFLLLAFRASFTDLRYAAAVAGILALALFEGGVYPFPYFCLFLAFDGVISIVGAKGEVSVRMKRRLDIVLAGLVALSLGLLMGAFRLVAILTTVTRYPRVIEENDAFRLDEILRTLIAIDYEYHLPGHQYVWAEYGTFIGLLALGLSVVGLVVAWDRGERWVVVGAVVACASMMGWASEYHPWPLLHHLPVFGSLRVPARFAVLLTFYLGLAAGLGIEHVARGMRLRRSARVSKLGPSILLALTTALLYYGNAAVIDRWRGPVLPTMDAPERYHVVAGREYGRYASFPARGVSTRGCYTGMEFKTADGVWEGDVPQARVPTGTLRSVERTANTITLDVTLAREGRVVVNQTYAVGWTASVGRAVRGPSGLIEIDAVPAGRRRIVLRFFPDELPMAASLSVLGVLLTVWVVRRGRALRTPRDFFRPAWLRTDARPQP